MLDIKFIRENPELVKENIRKKFQDAKLPLVDEVIALDEKNRAAITEASELRAGRNALSNGLDDASGAVARLAGEDGRGTVLDVGSDHWVADEVGAFCSAGDAGANRADENLPRSRCGNRLVDYFRHVGGGKDDAGIGHFSG